jgi:hypothetical protein
MLADMLLLPLYTAMSEIPLRRLNRLDGVAELGSRLPLAAVCQVITPRQ